MSASVIAAAISSLESIGLSSEEILGVVKDMLSAQAVTPLEAIAATQSTPSKSSAAIRQARYRAKNTSQTVTRDVTRDVTRYVTGITEGVTRYASSREGACADTQLTKIEIYPDKKENKNNVGLPLTPVTPVTPENMVGVCGKIPPAKRQTAPNCAPKYHPDFELLWREFPHQPNASKAKAYESWLRLPEEDRDKCFDGALAYGRFLITERQKRPEFPGLHLATFINQRRFDSLLEVRH